MFSMITFLILNGLIITAYQFWDLEKAFFWYGVVPNLILVPPKQLATVEYPLVDAHLGNEISSYDANVKPVVSWEADTDKLYTLVMVDADDTSNRDPMVNTVLHWLVGNIPGGLVEGGVEVFPYLGPSPLLGSGFHRYVFLIYEQPEKHEFDEPTIGPMPGSRESKKGSCDICGLKHASGRSRPTKTRVIFSIEKFAWKYQLGDPVAGNFFRSQYTGALLPIPLPADYRMIVDMIH